MNFRHLILAAAAVSALAFSAGFAPIADAATRQTNSVQVASVDATAGSTFATTSYADLAGATASFTPTVDPNRTEAAGTTIQADTILVEFNADVIKATTTTGTCAPYVNGAVVAKFARTIDVAAKQATMTIIAPVPNTTTATQTVKIQCKSGDSAVFTVNNGVMRVVEIY